MAILQWTPELSVGVESLDADHRQIIRLINQLDDAIKSGEPGATVRHVLDALLDYADYHFAREETLMQVSGYPDADAHIRCHKTLAFQVTNIRDHYVRNPESIHEREVLAFLKNWLTAHIMGRDKLYAPFMASKREQVEQAEQRLSEERERRLAASTSELDVGT